jgi:F-type H+-transporting ATPase subunit gamma
MSSFKAGEYDKVLVVYNQFKNAAVQHVMVEQMLPLVPPTATKKTVNDYIFEPAKEQLVLE